MTVGTGQQREMQRQAAESLGLTVDHDLAVMTADQTLPGLTAKLLTALAATLEQGRSEQLKNHLAAIARFHSYSWGNVALIISQRPDADTW